MRPMLDKLRKLYQETPIPAELDQVVDRAVRKGRRRRRWSYLATPLAAAAAFILVLNTSATFAFALYDIPVLGDLCRMVTFREYREETDTFVADVRIPAVDVSDLPGDTSWADEMNETITQTMEAEVQESMDRAQEYFDAYVATGGDPEAFIPTLIQVDYEVKHSDDSILSFVVYKLDTIANGYQRAYYYNVDLRTGENLTLEDFLGEDWVDLVTDAVERQLEELPEEKRQMLFEGIDVREVVSEGVGFYLGEDQVVVVFEEYTLGAGALGMLEFSVPLP